MEDKGKAKMWYRSKTVYFSVALGALGMAILAVPEWQALIESLPGQYQGLASLVLGMAALFLRSKTNEAVRFKK